MSPDSEDAEHLVNIDLKLIRVQCTGLVNFRIQDFFKITIDILVLLPTFSKTPGDEIALLPSTWLFLLLFFSCFFFKFTCVIEDSGAQRHFRFDLKVT